MKVKYGKSDQIRTCFNEHFKLCLQTQILKVENENVILYDPSNVLTFIDKDFFSVSSSSVDFEWMLSSLIFPGCQVQVENKVYVTISGLKYFFSSLVSHRACNDSTCKILEQIHSKFLNWFLKFDFDKFMRKAYGIEYAESCTFCQNVLDDSDIINESKSHDNDEQTFLLALAKVAGRKLGQLIIEDNKESQRNSQSSLLVKYDPQADWESSCQIVKTFIDSLLSENNSYLFKVNFRNIVFLGNHSKTFRRKPQSGYFISAVIKYTNDKQKILDLLSSIGIGVTDDAITNLEKNQIDGFNKQFWDIPSACSVMAVMDNNQADFTTKSFNPI